MPWTKITLTARDAHNNGRWKLLQDTFEELYMVAGGPGSIALFHRTEGDARDEVFYLTAAATDRFATIPLLFRGEPCTSPPREGLGLLVGRIPDAWDLVGGRPTPG